MPVTLLSMLCQCDPQVLPRVVDLTRRTASNISAVSSRGDPVDVADLAKKITSDVMVRLGEHSC